MPSSASPRATSSGPRSITCARWKSSPTTISRRFSSSKSFSLSGALRKRQRYARLGLKRAEEALRLHPEEFQACTTGRNARWRRSANAIGRRNGWRGPWRSIRTTIIARYNAACTYSLLGEFDRAIDLLEICLQQVGPDFKTMVQERFRSRPHPQPSALSEAARTRRIALAGRHQVRKRDCVCLPTSLQSRCWPEAEMSPSTIRSR